LPEVFSILQLGLGVASLGAQQEAAREQKKSAQLAQRRTANTALREAQMRRARAMVVGQNTGATPMVGQLGSQFGATAGYATQQSGLSGNISEARGRALALSGLSNLMPDFKDTYGELKKKGWL